MTQDYIAAKPSFDIKSDAGYMDEKQSEQNVFGHYVNISIYT